VESFQANTFGDGLIVTQKRPPHPVVTRLRIPFHSIHKRSAWVFSQGPTALGQLRIILHFQPIWANGRSI
jgi:hypothetical protein